MFELDKELADEVIVLSGGKVVEQGRALQVIRDPQDAYTRKLLDAIPKMHDTGHARTPVQGEVPNPLNPPTGCAFHPRCPLANARCSAERPVLLDFGGAQVACHAVEEGRITAAVR